MTFLRTLILMSIFALNTLIPTTSFASDNSILQFTNSKDDPDTGKKILKMIIKAVPKGIFKENAENITNKKKELAYTITSNGQGTSKSDDVLLDFQWGDTRSHSTKSHSIRSHSISANPYYEGHGYKMFLTLDFSRKLLTKEGHEFFDTQRKNWKFINGKEND